MPNEFTDALVSAEQLKTFIDEDSDLLIIDLCSDEHFNEGHIQGAFHVKPAQLSCGIKPAPGKLPTQEALQTLFQDLGVNSDKHIIVYDDAGSSWAGRMIWTLHLLGFNAKLLNGGRFAWQKAGFSFSQDITTATKSAINISINPSNIADMDEILGTLNDDHVQVWDARSSAEYRGEKVLAKKGGHIPGAIHLEWTELIDAEGFIRSKADIESLLADKNIDPNKTIITHCQTHRRSGLTWFVAKKLLGFSSIKAYPGSWAEWGNSDECPTENDL